jgi:predicted HTH transcriptional regulator
VEIDRSPVQDLLEHLAESLNVEVKRWIKIEEPDGIAKVARAALALRNRNGGFLVIGFDVKTPQPFG